MSESVRPMHAERKMKYSVIFWVEVYPQYARE
jgi:hypothetical protein